MMFFKLCPKHLAQNVLSEHRVLLITGTQLHKSPLRLNHCIELKAKENAGLVFPMAVTLLCFMVFMTEILFKYS